MVQGLLTKGLDGAVDWLVDFEGDSSSGPTRSVQADTFDPGVKKQLTPEDYEAYRKAREAGDEEAIAAFRQKQEQQERDDRRSMRSFEQWCLTRMIETPRPLEEKLTLFWHGHFAASYTTVENSWHMFRQNQFFFYFYVHFNCCPPVHDLQSTPLHVLLGIERQQCCTASSK